MTAAPGAYTYMLRCADGSYYVGTARLGLDRRVSEHNTGAYGGYTSKRRLVTLVNDMGERLPRDDVRASDLIVPAADMTLADAKKLLDAGASGPAS